MTTRFFISSISVRICEDDQATVAYKSEIISQPQISPV